MKIGIDARLIHETGVGRYIQNLVRELSDIDHENTYVLFLRKKDFHDFKLPGPRWSKRVADVRWHTLTEQLVMPWLLWKEHCDVVHVPYFNAPILYRGALVITIHDLTILHVDTGRASTLPYFLYKLRRAGYRLILTAAIKRASCLIAVSESVKRDIIKSFRIGPQKIRVTYEGIDPAFISETEKSEKRLPLTGAYFLYVGNVFPHKNVETMLEAYRQYDRNTSQPASLVFVGPSDYFYRRFESIVSSLNFRGNVLFLHQVDDQTLRVLYKKATALLFPSLMEGFGLPALEALALGCRVIASDIPVFREVLGEYATYVDTKNPDEFAEALTKISHAAYDRQANRQKVKQFILRYNWKKMALVTLEIYRQLLHP